MMVRLIISNYPFHLEPKYLAVTAIGSPSGIKATATLTQLTIRVATFIKSGWLFRSQVALPLLASKPMYDKYGQYQISMTTMFIVIIMATITKTK
jgi:hypothetical protein